MNYYHNFHLQLDGNNAEFCLSPYVLRKQGRLEEFPSLFCVPENSLLQGIPFSMGLRENSQTPHGVYL